MRAILSVLVCSSLLTGCSASTDDEAPPSGSSGAAGAAGAAGASGAGGAGTGGASGAGTGGAAGGAGSAGASGATCGADVTPAPGIVVTDRGAVKGSDEGSTYSYKNIPFAAPPVGALRWKPPASAACWSGVRDATAWGNTCPQSDDTATAPVVGDEDCLGLNVWSPKDAAGLPVMVWIHGGGNELGSATQQTAGIHFYDAQHLATRGKVVVVTVNYRLGVLGFLAHPGLTKEASPPSSGNYGLLDLVAALSWVKANAKAFGGDPARVTIFGESAGGQNVCSLVASPRANGLFSGAIIQSGGCAARPLATAEANGASVAKSVGCDAAPDPVACMRALPADTLVAKGSVPVQVAGAGGPYGPLVDGWFHPEAPLDTIATGKHNHVPVVIGTNENETSRTTPLDPTATDAEYQTAVKALFGALADKVLGAYPSSTYASPWDAYVALTTDAKFVCSARRAARALTMGQTEPVYRYVFDHPLDFAPKQKPFGTWHGIDVLYVFDWLTVGNYVPSPAEKSIVGWFQDGWSGFAGTHDPTGSFPVAWPAWTSADPYLRIGSMPTTGTGVRTQQCDFWDGIL